MRVGNLRTFAQGTAVAVLLCVLGSGAVSAAAPTTPTSGLTITPAALTISLAPHTQQQSATVNLINHYATPVTLQFEVQAGAGESAPSADAAVHKQLAVAQPQVTLEPGASYVQTITFTDSPQLTPGSQQIDLVVYQTSIPGAQVGVNASMRVPLILIKETGAISSLALTAVNQSRFALQTPSTLTATLRNTGNMIAVPRGVITVRSPSGNIIAEGALNTASRAVSPGQTLAAETTLTHLGSSAWPGVYRVETIYGLGGDSRGQTASYAFLYLAWWHIASIALLAIGFTSAIRNRSRLAKFLKLQARHHSPKRPALAGRRTS